MRALRVRHSDSPARPSAVLSDTDTSPVVRARDCSQELTHDNAERLSVTALKGRGSRHLDQTHVVLRALKTPAAQGAQNATHELNLTREGAEPTGGATHTVWGA